MLYNVLLSSTIYLCQFIIFVGNVQREFFDETQEYHSDIPGLISRVKNPLEFLGLYDTRNSACKRHDIPAIKVKFLQILN